MSGNLPPGVTQRDIDEHLEGEPEPECELCGGTEGVEIEGPDGKMREAGCPICMEEQLRDGLHANVTMSLYGGPEMLRKLHEKVEKNRESLKEMDPVMIDSGLHVQEARALIRLASAIVNRVPSLEAYRI